MKGRDLSEARSLIRRFAASGGSGGPVAWGDVTGKPSTFPPETHSHATSDITGLAAALAAIPVKGTATVTVPNNSREWSETVAAAGVTAGKIIMLAIAPHDDADENDAETLDIAAMIAAPGTDQITVELAFDAPTRGAIKLNWMAA